MEQIEQEVTIIFTDGTELEAMLNATTYIVDEKPGFPANLSEVTVQSKDGSTTVYNNVEIIEAYSDDGKYRFIIVEVPSDIISKERMDAQVMYTALMTDTLIEEE